MKKIIIHLILVVSICNNYYSQGFISSPGGIYDVVSDRFGNTYRLADITTSATKPLGNTATINSSADCSAGYFDLYFDQSASSFTSAASRSVICQVFTDISAFIQSPLSSTSNTVRINIFCSDGAFAATAGASAFYVYPSNPTNPNQTFIRGQIQQAIMSGVDPYLSIPLSSANSANFFHGFVIVNPGITMDYNFSTIPTTGYDFYSIMLHEVMHALGFNSLIGPNGTSIFGASNNYFSDYDRFLVDNNNSPILASSTPSSCANSNISLSSSVSITAIKPGNCTNTGTPVDVSTCSLATRYVSGAVTATVYTPNCFEVGSSLSHFEDICVASTSTCFTTPTNNNLYYVMSNSSGPGSCYVKRFLKPAERLVLCDLGYSVSTTYSSTSGAIIDPSIPFNMVLYNASCTPVSIVGLNDGVVAGTFIFNTTGTLVTIPTSSILSNDIPNTGLSISCLQVVYTNTNSNVSASVAGSVINVTATSGSGLALLSYIPVNGSNQSGNLTYIYVYFSSANCNPVNACSLIQNGGFENIITSTACGQMSLSSGPILGCWDRFQGNPAVFSRSCTIGSVYNLGVNTVGSSIPVNSFNGVGNDRFVGLRYEYTGISGSPTQALINNLSAPLTPSNVYKLSFMAHNPASSIPGDNVSSSPVVITIATNDVYSFSSSNTFPSGLNVIAEFTLPVTNTWTMLTQTFTFNSLGNLNHQAILVGINSGQTVAQGSLNVTSPPTNVWCYIDEFNLVTVPSPTISFASTICGNTAIYDLDSYSSISGGTFSGVGVTINNGQFDFNVSGTLTPGLYPIAYNYSAGGCTNTVYNLVTVSTNTNYVLLSNTVACMSNPTLNLNSLFTNSAYINSGFFSVDGAPSTNTITFGSASTYSVGFTFTSSGSLCTNSSNQVSIVVYPTISPLTIFNGSTAVSATNICMGDILNFTAASSATNHIWQPGSITGTILPFTPTNSVVYTVTAFDHTACPISATVAINVYTNCCNSVIIPVAQISSSTTLLQGPLLVTSDFTVTSALAIQSGEYRFKPDIQVTIANGGWIALSDVHFLSCDNNMWNGINILDGGLFTTNTSAGHNLIEDAKRAISVYDNSVTTSTSIFSITNTTFNKNYIDIDIFNYPSGSNTFSNVFSINNCVFTCRDFSYTPTSWPGVYPSNGLREAPSGTTGISSPYPLLNAPIANLLPPYQNGQSYTAIRLVNVGVTTGTSMYGPTIGSDASASDFNLFDSHGIFISANNSNLTVKNNVFQNTLPYYVVFNPTLGLLVPSGGDAIKHENYSMNSKLDLMANSVSVGNRFWNCHTAVYAKDLLRFNMENAIIRSSQSTASLTSQIGVRGLVMPTNRFQYFIKNNEFTNINSPINIPIAAGIYTTISTGTQTGIYADKILIHYNNFSAGTPTTNYINTAINITAPNNFPYTVANDYNIAPFTKAIVVEQNTLTNVFRGINVNGITGYQTKIDHNNISLRQDNFFGTTQRAIELSNTMGTGNVAGQHIVANNEITGASTTNSVETLVYSSINSGLYSPSVTCNELNNSYNGFVFNSTNTLAIWAGNNMQPLAQGLVLSGNGRIGAQGTASIASNNEWQSTWSGNHTFVDGFSDGIFSKLWTKSGSTYSPTLNGGLFSLQNYNQNNNNLGLSVGGDYQCGGVPNSIVIGPPSEFDYSDAGYYYIAKTAFYRFLHFNDSVKDSDGALSSFYSDIEGSSIDKFMQVEEKLYQGNLAEAASLLTGIETEGTIAPEENYKEFYGRYLNYLNLNQDSVYSVEDSTALHALSLLCPSTDGAAVYQARALYNTIYASSVIFADCEEGMGARPAKNNDESDNSTEPIALWAAELFPNPASSQINIVTKKHNENLKIILKDIMGRTIIVATLKTTNYVGVLDVELINGAYFITIINDADETVTKKLLIAK